MAERFSYYWHDKVLEVESERDQMVAENQQLREERDALSAQLGETRERLDECQLRYIEVTNPGIDMDEVKAIRNKAAVLSYHEGTPEEN